MLTSLIAVLLVYILFTISQSAFLNDFKSHQCILGLSKMVPTDMTALLLALKHKHFTSPTITSAKYMYVIGALTVTVFPPHGREYES